MTKTTKAGIIGCVAGLAIAILAFVAVEGWSKLFQNNKDAISTNERGGSDQDGQKKGADPSNDLTGEKESERKKDVEEPKPMGKIERDSVPTSAVDQVRSRRIKGEFQLTGRGENANWGIRKEGKFVYTLFVDADSQIKKEPLPSGAFRVTETRTFYRVQDSLVVSDVDIKLDLDSLPIKEFSNMIDAACIAWASMTGDPLSSSAIMVTKDYVTNKLKDVDGIGVKSLLGWVGIDMPDAIKNNVDQLAGRTLKKALGAIRSISGKSYKIVYYQDGEGQPLCVKFTYSDDKEITDDEEKMVLRRVNAFIDYNMVPNKNCAPGDTWKVKADDIQELFDPYANDNKYTGTISVKRKVNTPEGDWDLDLEPSVINVLNSNNSSSGYYNLQRGHALVDPKLVSVKELFAAGTANIQTVTKHHWLFNTRFSGECQFQGKLVSTPKE